MKPHFAWLIPVVTSFFFVTLILLYFVIAY